MFEHGMYGTTVHLHKINQLSRVVRNAKSLLLQYIPIFKKSENCVRKKKENSCRKTMNFMLT